MDEACDYGEFAFDGEPEDAPYGGCTDQCLLGPYCGDETQQSEYGEECDLGADNQDNVYDGCTRACLLGPHCGDAVLQTAGGEVCDNGFNEDDYAYPGAVDACGPECTEVPYCGDGQIQDAYEFCDDGEDNSDTKYDGCTSKCEYGPYCGDGKKSGNEECDDGRGNVAYSPDGKACGYDCKPAPYCGDGTRNGSEQCDLGTDKNDGKYNGCKSNCQRAPYCGDRIVQKDNKEECDDGPNGSLTCTNMCKARDDIIR
jgi:cysteine-rich repeat protein